MTLKLVAVLFHKEYLYFIIPVVALLAIIVSPHSIDAGANPEFDQPAIDMILKIVIQFESPKGVTLDDINRIWDGRLNEMNNFVDNEFRQHYKTEKFQTDLIFCDKSLQDEILNRYEICMKLLVQGDYDNPTQQKDNDVDLFYQHLQQDLITKFTIDKNIQGLMVVKQLNGIKEFRTI